MEKQKLIKVYKSPRTHNCSYDGLAIDETLRLTEKEYSRFKKYKANLKQLKHGDIIRITSPESEGERSYMNVYQCSHARSEYDGSFYLHFEHIGSMEERFTIEKINKKSFMEAVTIWHVQNLGKDYASARIEGCVNLEKLIVDKKLEF